jgi:hypothetical protein
MGRRILSKSAASIGKSNRRSAALRPMLVILCLVLFAAGIAALPNTTRRVGAQTTQDKPQDYPVGAIRHRGGDGA